MREDELKARLQAAVDHRLSALEGDPWLARRIIQAEKGDRPFVKKKLSVSFVLILVVMLLTLSAAVALVNSNIAGQLFGSEENAPQAVLESIHTPQTTTAKEFGTLTLDEWLYDGNLHTAFTITNPTDEPLLYTLDGIWLGEKHITYNHNRTDGAGDSGFLLGGTVDGTAMPASQTLYNLGEELHQYDENGKWLGTVALPEGANKLKVSVAVWRPLNPVKLVDYDQYEGYDVTETRDHITVDDSGFSNLWMFRPQKYSLPTTAKDIPSAIYAAAYKELGWLELVDTIEVEIDVNLSKTDVAHAMPKQMEYEQDGCRIVFEQFEMTQSGGAIEGWIYGEYNAVKSLLEGGLHVVDAAGQRVLDSGCWWDSQSEDAEGLRFGIYLAPMTGNLPTEIQLVHIPAVDNRWDENDPLYDPSLEKPENVIGMYQIDYNGAITLELEIK